LSAGSPTRWRRPSSAPDARSLLGAPDASRPELRFTATRLTECLFDALRVAESRGERLADADGEEEDR
jgi:hypothetical protein